jgi:Amt family ammonium transporter
MKRVCAVIILLLASSSLAFADQASGTLSGANTAWVLVATALIMFMTMPALGMFYGGLVRRKNVLTILMQCTVTLAVVSVIWVAFGYSMAFSDTELVPGVLGDLKWAFFNGIGPLDLSPYAVSDPNGRIPHVLFAMFQCMFAVITPAVVISAFAERMKFSSFLVFTVLWEILIYTPLAHMAWSANGLLAKAGLLDFAGGTVVEINAGFSALAASLVIGKRSNLKALPPHNLPFAAFGAGMLWFGWFGFNAGSGLAADGIAASAFMATNAAAASAGLAWGAADWLVSKRPTLLGVITGAIVGMVAVTPAAGYVNAAGALAIGAIASLIVYPMVTYVKGKLGYDDSLDAFGCHGIGGLVGTLLTGVFADPAIWSGYGKDISGGLWGNWRQFGVQALGSAAAIAISFAGTFLIFKLVNAMMGIRVDAKSEAIGLDVTQHHERAYTVID